MYKANAIPVNEHEWLCAHTATYDSMNFRIYLLGHIINLKLVAWLEEWLMTTDEGRMKMKLPYSAFI